MSIESETDRPPRLLPRTIEDVLRAWTVRAAGAVLAISALIVSLAMLTWSANDPSLSLDTSEPAQNLLGPAGAVVADFFFHTLGLSVVFFVVPPLVLGVQLALGDIIKDLRQRMIWIAGSTLAIAGGCSALPLTDTWSFELGYGGIIGDFAYSIAGGLGEKLAPDAGGAITGLVFFAFGFWMFSRAICLDQYGVFALSWSLPATQVDRRYKDTFRWNSLFRKKPKIKTTAHAGLDLTSTHMPQAPVELHPLEATEPAPPNWSLDDRMNDYSENVGRTEFPADDEAARHPGTASAPAPVDSILTRLAPETGNNLPVQTILLDDDDGADEVDLPNVLKRAREEATELLSRTTPQDHHQQRPVPMLQMPPRKAVVQERRTSPSRNEPQPAPLEQRSTPSATATNVHASAPKVVASGYRRPSLNLLRAQKPSRPSADISPSVLQGRARTLQDVLSDFRINGEIQDVKPGPVITLFEFEPSRGTKSSRVVALADDVARSMEAVSARIAVVPGRNVIGVELPNTRRETFGLRELIDSQQFIDSSAKLPLVLGKDIAGGPVMADLARMPHLLVAGTTGSGKSVGINAMILSLIYRMGPDACRLLLIDPKMLELSAYNGIPHLLTPVITDPQKAVTALTWAVGEMEERYKRMAELGVRSIEAFNNRARHAQRTGEKLGRTVQTGFDPSTGEAIFEETTIDAEPLPHIVIVVDEFADLMAVAGKEIEGLVQRLAQMARAAGIHLIMATQRPSVDVVTGTIKANFPTRISYRVASRIDSRTILGEQGGEQLLGQGDMLYLDGTGHVQRVHGPFVSDEEVEAVTSALRSSYPTQYNDDVLKVDEMEGAGKSVASGKSGDLYDQAVALVLRDHKASTSYLQRRLGIGYNRAADLMDRMEEQGVIGTADHAGRREILLAG